MLGGFRVFADVGNSRTKVAVVAPQSKDWLSFQSVSEPEELNLLIPADATWSVVSVNQPRLAQLSNWVARQRPADAVQVISNRHFPIQLDVLEPERVGVDRVAAAYGALCASSKRGPLIVINVGTAVTIDFVNAENVFEGGMIFPGPFTCFQSLHHSTDQLPAIFEPEIPTVLIGKSTHQAIGSGVWNMQIGAIRHCLQKIRVTRDASNCRVFMSGGGARPLVAEFEGDIRHIRDLVLVGIRSAANESSSPEFTGAETSFPR